MKDYPGRYIAVLYRKAQVYWTQELAVYGLSSGEYPLIFCLCRKDGVVQEELAELLNIDKSAIARMVQSLEKKGMIRREKDERDHRCNRIFLTEKGHQCDEPIQKLRGIWNDRLMEGMSEEERGEFLRLLEMAAKNITGRQG